MKNHYLIGKRIRIDEMVNEPFPVESGTMGTITNVGYDIINVKWDNGRSLGVVIGEDKYEVFD
jgi:hypothetical protein